MGVSTDGILFYGIPYGEGYDDELKAPWWHGCEDEEPDSESHYEDPEDYYAYKMGVEPPTEEYSEEPSIREKFLKYWKAQRAIYEKSGCDIIYYCSDQCTMFAVGIEKSIKCAHRGDALEIENLDVQPEWDGLLKHFCEIMEVPYKQPKWLLVSYYG